MKKHLKTESSKITLDACNKRVLELETSLLYLSKTYPEIVHNINSSTHKLLSHTFILARNFDYLDDLISIFSQLGSKEVNSTIDKFKDGVDIKSIKKISKETLRSIEIAVHEIHMNSKELHIMSREINHIINKK